MMRTGCFQFVQNVGFFEGKRGGEGATIYKCYYRVSYFGKIILVNLVQPENKKERGHLSDSSFLEMTLQNCIKHKS